MKLKKCLTLLLLSGVCSVLPATDTLWMSIDQAVDYAMSHNLTLRNARLEMDAADRKILETIATGLPQIDGNLNFQHTLSEIPTVNFDDNEVTLGVKNNVVGTGQLGQLIFNGSYIVGLQASKVYKSLSVVSSEQQEIEVRQTVIQSYYTALMAMQQVDILSENLTLMNTTLYEITRMYEQGLIEKISVSQMEVNRNLLETEYASSLRQRDLTLRLLKYAMGMPLDTPLRLSGSLGFALAALPAEYLQDVPFDPLVHVIYRGAEVQIKLASLQKKLEISSYFPSIQGFINYQYNFTLPQFSFVTPQTWIAGATLSVPLFSSGMRKSKVAQAKIALEQAKNSQQLALQGLYLEFEQSHEAFRTAYDRYHVQKDNLQIAKEVLSQYNRKYVLGMATSTELTQANNDYLKVVSSFLTAEIELLNTKVSMDKVLSKL